MGLERAGLECSWQVEIDDYASRVLARHWPDVRRWRNVKTFVPDTASERRGAWGPRRTAARRERRSNSAWAAQWRVDLIAGGFPCQDISYAGKGAGLSGKRSGLWYEFVRIVRVLRPRYVLVENVAALLVRGLDAVLGTLASLGYDAEWHCIQAADVGAPHIRDRVFIMANSNPYGTAVVQSNGEKEKSEFDSSRRDNSQRLRENLARFQRESGQVQWGLDPANDPESGVGRMAYGVPNRVDRLRGLGNAVVPQVAEWIGRRIIEFDAKASV